MPLTGKYRGAAHRNCNLQVKVPNFIPIFAHNLSNYDLHLFVKMLCKMKAHIFELFPERAEQKVLINIIPKSAEKFSCVSVNFITGVKEYKDKDEKIHRLPT